MDMQVCKHGVEMGLQQSSQFANGVLTTTFSQVWCQKCLGEMAQSFAATPTPNPSPQGGGERRLGA